MRPIFPMLLFAACSTDLQLADKNNQPPAVVINAPETGSAFLATEVVEFVATVTDPNQLSDIGSLVWTSNIDGEIASLDDAAPDAGGISRTALVLSPGNHAITLAVTDSAGNSATDSIDVSVGEATEDPVVDLTSPVNFQEYLPGDTVELKKKRDALDPKDLVPGFPQISGCLNNRQAGAHGCLIQIVRPASPSGFAHRRVIAKISAIRFFVWRDDMDANLKQIAIATRHILARRTIY